MAGIIDMDRLTTDVAQVIHASVPPMNWRIARMSTNYSPAGVGAFQFTYIDEVGHADKGKGPNDEHLNKLSDLTLEHWRLTQDLGQPRWYKMIVTVERSGKFNVEFEYKDDYQEGDIMRD